MIRALLATILALASAFANAQNTQITVNVSYTPAAAAYATSLGTTVTTLVAKQISDANAAYAASGINITLYQEHDPLPSGNSAPSDQSTAAQYQWVHNSPIGMQQRGDDLTGSSISIQISDPGPSAPFTGTMFGGTVNVRKDAVGALPIRGVAGGIGLELMISKIIGSDPVYARRENRYGYQKQGTMLCVHTRESTDSPIPTTTPVPNLSPIYWLFLTPYTGQATNGSPTAAITCEAARVDFVASPSYGCGANGCASTALSGTDPSYTCHIKKSDGTDLVNYPLNKTVASGSAPITCTENWTNTYATPSRSFAGVAMGDSTHDSVTKMNNRAATVSNFSHVNRDTLKRALSAILDAIRSAA